jgi:GNAT superfamily N-acetyltransferase
MKIINLNKNDYRAFSFLAPSDKFALLGLSGYEAVGGLATPDDDESGSENEVPAALMILTFEPGERLIIEWLYVDDDYSGQSLGEGLLARAYEIAAEGDMPELSVRFEGRLAALRYDHPLEGFFRDRYFDRGYSMPGVWRITSAEADKLITDKDEKDTEYEPVPVASLSDSEKEELYAQIEKTDDAAVVLFDPVVDPKEALDEEHSLVISHGEKCVAMLLFRRIGTCRMASVLYGTNRKALRGLIMASLDALADGKVDETMEFRFRSREDRNDIREIVPEATVIDVLYLTADTVSYELYEIGPETV